MGAVARARDFDRDRNAQLATRMCEGLCIAAPIGVVEIDSQEMAGIVGQQRIDADGVTAGKMVVEGLVSQWYQEPVAAVGALDARLLANACAPFVGTRGRIAGLARLALPAHWIDIGAATKQPAEERDLFVCG